VVAGLLAGACSSDSGSAAKAAVKKVTVERIDLPPEWTQVAAPDPVGAEGDESRFAECIGRPDPKTVRKAKYASDEFRMGDAMRITSVAQTMPDEATAKADLAAQRGDRGAPCLRSGLKNALDRRSVAGNAPESVTVDRLPGLDVGDESVAFRGTLTYPATDTGPKTAYVDVVYVRKGALEIAVTFSSTQQPFSTDLERDLLTKVVGRT